MGHHPWGALHWQVCRMGANLPLLKLQWGGGLAPQNRAAGPGAAWPSSSAGQGAAHLWASASCFWAERFTENSRKLQKPTYRENMSQACQRASQAPWWVQIPSLPHQRAHQTALAGDGMWGEHSPTCISNSSTVLWGNLSKDFCSAACASTQ